MIAIEPERPTHHDAIATLLDMAFGGRGESGLVERLRQGGHMVVALVARYGGQLAGHAMFSHLACEVDGRPVKAVALAPLAVRPDLQRRGIGTALVQRGVQRLEEEDVEAIIVLGDPAYYGRFGFSSGLAEKLSAPFHGPAFMALELAPGALSGRRGSIKFPAAFGPL